MTRAGLELSYNWQRPVLVSTLGLAACLAMLVRGRVNGWLSMLGVLVLVWAVYLTTVWLRTRAAMILDGPILRVRRYLHFHDVDARQVSAVKEFLTANGPSYRLTVQAPDGESHCIVPSALLKKGHSTLFEWILTWAPEVALDKGSRKTIDQLRLRGMIP